jgi:hypothetical protein
MIRLSAGNTEFHVPPDRIVHIDHAGSPSPVPFAAGAVEGLARVGDLPVLQIDLGRLATGQPGTGDKLVAVAVNGSALALRVERVDRVSEAAAANAPALDAMLAPLRSGLVALPPSKDTAIAGPGHGAFPGLTVLPVVIAGQTFALPCSTIRAVARPEALWTPRAPGHPAEALAMIDARIVRAWRTAPAGGAMPAWAVLFDSGAAGATTREALLVDTVGALTRVGGDRLQRMDADGSLWAWLDDDSAPVEVVAPAQIVPGGGTMPGPVCPGLGNDRADRGRDAALAGMAAMAVTGLAIRCGDIAFIGDIDGVERVVDTAAALLASQNAHLDERTDEGRHRLLDAAVLLGRRDAPRPGLVVQVRLSGPRPGKRDTLLNVDSLAPRRGRPDWLPLPLVPAAVAALVDAAAWDAGGWLLRLRREPDWRTIVRAIGRGRGRARECSLGTVSDSVLRGAGLHVPSVAPSMDLVFDTGCAA